MRHLFGVLGVAAAGVLLAVSAAMNWRFGYLLGKTEIDGLIYGSASVAADVMKALMPFFFFAALRNRMWSQAAASAVLWVVVTSFSLTSALGHAALNRHDKSGERAHEAQSYKDARADLKRAQDQLSWIPQHRPAATVQSELDGLKSQRAWVWTKSCTDVNGKFNREYCQKYSTLTAELASAQEAAKLEARIAETSAKIGTKARGAVTVADPQAAVLTQLASLVLPSLKVEDMQLALTLFIAILLEVGSGFGLFVAFSAWRPREEQMLAVPAAKPAMVVAAKPIEVAAPVVAPVVQPQAKVAVHEEAPQVVQRASANDNRSSPRLVAPETDVERFYRERVGSEDGSSLTATALYEDYCAWCEEQHKEPLALPTFGREFGELGVRKEKIAGRVRYIGVALRSGKRLEEDKKSTASRAEAA
jgi:hypothetical protein